MRWTILREVDPDPLHPNVARVEVVCACGRGPFIRDRADLRHGRSRGCRACAQAGAKRGVPSVLLPDIRIEAGEVMTCEEIAQTLGVSSARVQQIIDGALAKFRRRWGRLR